MHNMCHRSVRYKRSTQNADYHGMLWNPTRGQACGASAPLGVPRAIAVFWRVGYLLVFAFGLGVQY